MARRYRRHATRSSPFSGQPRRRTRAQYLERVKAGEALVVTERGREVARLVPSQGGAYAEATARFGASVPSERLEESPGVCRAPALRPGPPTPSSARAELGLAADRVAGLYLDTSALGRVLLAEPESEAVLADAARHHGLTVLSPSSA